MEKNLTEIFLIELGASIKLKLKKFDDWNYNQMDYYNMSLDLFQTDYETVSEFEKCKKKYIASINNLIPFNDNDYFQIKLTNIESVEYFQSHKVDTVLTFTLDVAKLYDGYAEDETLPFYTMLYIQMNYIYWEDGEQNYNLKYKTDYDRGLIDRTNKVLLGQSIQSIGQQTTFEILCST
jgi:hypothetical protein